MEYTAHFQKGRRVGARRLRMVTVDAENATEAVRKARREFPDKSFELICVDHFNDDYRRVIDYSV